MNMKTALIGSFAAAAALVAVSADANARSWHYRSTSCGPSATIIKHNRYGFVGSDRDYGVRSRTYVRGERYGWRGGHDRIGVNIHERSGAKFNVNARVRGGEDRHGARFSGNQRNMGAGAGGATGRSVSPGGTSAGTSGGASAGGAAKSGGAGLGASGGTSGSGGGGMSSGGGGMSSGGGGGGGSR